MMSACIREPEVLEAVRLGEWSPELRVHREGCPTCAELTLVASVLRRDADELADDDWSAPDPAVIMVRARLAKRDRDLRRATRAIAWVQRATVAAALAAGAAFAPLLWNWLERTVSGASLELASVELPRAAGSPLLVVAASLLVLGGLALWELTSVDANPSDLP